MAEPDYTTVRYGSWDGYPVRFTPFEAWEFYNDTWRRVSVPGEIAVTAALLSAQEFDVIFGPLPPLPSDAFQKTPAAKP